MFQLYVQVGAINDPRPANMPWSLTWPWASKRAGSISRSEQRFKLGAGPYPRDHQKYSGSVLWQTADGPPNLPAIRGELLVAFLDDRQKSVWRTIEEQSGKHNSSRIVITMHWVKVKRSGKSSKSSRRARVA